MTTTPLCEERVARQAPSVGNRRGAPRARASGLQRTSARRTENDGLDVTRMAGIDYAVELEAARRALADVDSLSDKRGSEQPSIELCAEVKRVIGVLERLAEVVAAAKQEGEPRDGTLAAARRVFLSKTDALNAAKGGLTFRLQVLKRNL
jgi:hypothetical protein